MLVEILKIHVSTLHVQTVLCIQSKKNEVLILLTQYIDKYTNTEKSISVSLWYWSVIC